jgi:hypothetical protein
MIYLDTYVALAHLLAGDCAPPDSLWQQPLVSSRVIEYELWTRIHAHRLGATHGRLLRKLVDRVALMELGPPILVRALAPFPSPVQTLHALHLASIEFLRERGHYVALATYDRKMSTAAERLNIPLYDTGDP